MADPNRPVDAQRNLDIEGLLADILQSPDNGIETANGRQSPVCLRRCWIYCLPAYHFLRMHPVQHILASGALTVEYVPVCPTQLTHRI